MSCPAVLAGRQRRRCRKRSYGGLRQHMPSCHIQDWSTRNRLVRHRVCDREFRTAVFVKPVCSLVPVIPGAGWRVGATVRHAYGCVRRVGVHVSLSLWLSVSLARSLSCSLPLHTPRAARARAVAALAFRVIAIPVACPVSRGARARAPRGRARGPAAAGRARGARQRGLAGWWVKCAKVPTWVDAHQTC